MKKIKSDSIEINDFLDYKEKEVDGITTRILKDIKNGKFIIIFD